jgi:hypothetical protein
MCDTPVRHNEQRPRNQTLGHRLGKSNPDEAILGLEVVSIELERVLIDDVVHDVADIDRNGAASEIP